jgi:hypothetical protein
MNAMTCCAHDCNANACVTPECYKNPLDFGFRVPVAIFKCVDDVGLQTLASHLLFLAKKNETSQEHWPIM